jgi:lipoyl(octanoyl) transferase
MDAIGERRDPLSGGRETHEAPRDVAPELDRDAVDGTDAGRRPEVAGCIVRRLGVTARRLGVTDYLDTWRAMQAFTESRDGSTPDELWLTAHPPVYTLGVAGRDAHLPRDDAGIPVVRTDRGGQITYHGPGQIVVYTLVDLKRAGLTVRALVRQLEDAVVDVLADRGVTAQGDIDRPGVYVDGAKIAALGLKVRRGCSYHGLSFNADLDLAPFAAIDPCGYPGLAVTTARRLGITDSLETLADALLDRLAVRLSR